MSTPSGIVSQPSFVPTIAGIPSSRAMLGGEKVRKVSFDGGGIKVGRGGEVHGSVAGAATLVGNDRRALLHAKMSYLISNERKG